MAHWADAEEITIANAIPIPRRSKLRPDQTQVEHLLANGEGTPVVVTDGQRGWRAPGLWSFEYLAQRYGDASLIANDLAPLRHDASTCNATRLH